MEKEEVMSTEIRESVFAHYNPFAGRMVGRKIRQGKWGKGTPVVNVDGVKKEPVLSSPFLGSKISPKNRRAYMRSQIEYFIERHTADVISGREKIESQKDKTEDEISHEVALYNMSQPTEEEQLGMAERFARYQCNKENKHYRAWCAGKRHFIFQKEVFPVMTEEFVMKSKEAKEIKRVDGGDQSGGTAETGVELPNVSNES